MLFIFYYSEKSGGKKDFLMGPGTYMQSYLNRSILLSMKLVSANSLVLCNDPRKGCSNDQRVKKYGGKEENRILKFKTTL